MSRDLLDVTAELTGYSAILAGYSQQLTEGVTGRLTDKALGEALYSVGAALMRLVEDLDKIDSKSRAEGVNP